MGKSPIPFFMDHCVPASTSKLLVAAGHDVILLKDCMPTDTKDPVIAIACAENARVLVTHDKDFKQISKKLNIVKREFALLHRVSMRCDDPLSAARMQDALSLIEWEWDRCGCGTQQMIIEVTNATIKVIR